MRTVADMPRKITTAELFRIERMKAGLSVAELAEKSGVAERTLHYIEAGEIKQPQMSTIRAVAEALDVPHTDLIPEVAA